MATNEFREKYHEVIAMIGKHKKVDMDVATAMFVSTLRGHFGETFTAAGEEKVWASYIPEDFPSDFDWDQAYEDWKSSVTPKA